MELGRQFADYRGRHQPDLTDESVGIHEVDRLYPKFYENTNVYRQGPIDATHRETVGVLNRVRGNPTADVTIYRGVPKSVTGIHPGDWVTPSRRYAEQHVRSNVPGGHVVRRVVKAHEVREGSGNSIHEWGWNPPEGER